MKRHNVLWLILVTFVMPQAGLTQGMVEQGGVYSSVAGLGAGLAAGGRTHADTLKRSFEAVGRAQQAVQKSVTEQGSSIEQSMKLGCQYQASKQWEYAEGAFKSVLQGVARRDGPGSFAAVPALKHLVDISEAQHKLDDAIGFQKTVTAFSKVGRVLDYSAFASEQIRLCELYAQRGDYGVAEPTLRDILQEMAAHPDMADKDRCAALSCYNDVLRRLHKEPYIASPAGGPGQSQPANETGSPEMAQAEATQLLDCVNNTILKQRTALLIPQTTVIQGQDLLPEKNPGINQTPTTP